MFTRIAAALAIVAALVAPAMAADTIKVGAILAVTGPASFLGAPEAKSLEMLQRSVGFRTVEGEGQVPAYAEYLAGELRAHGFAAEDITITPRGETATLTARYRGTDPTLKPILIASPDSDAAALAALDVEVI